MDALGLVRLLQLASPALPVGAYSYSQGMEAAIEAGVVKDTDSARQWIQDVLELSMGGYEAPLLWRMQCALMSGDAASFKRWNSMLCAGRETLELRSETLQMGQALLKLLTEFPECAAWNTFAGDDEMTFAAAFALAAHGFKVEREAALLAYLWSWLENQVMAAIKAVPLGQTAGQRMLVSLGGELPAVVKRAMRVDNGKLSNFAPRLAILSCRHETQYSRLFRS